MLETQPSICPMDCPDTCSLEIGVTDGRVTSIRGDFRNPLTQGFICSKVSRFSGRLYARDRLLYPQRRIGPKGNAQFRRISWSEAIDEITSRIKQAVLEHGAESVLPYAYGGSNGLMTHGLVDEYFFRRLGSSRLDRTVCAVSTTAALNALYGKMPGTAFEDYPHAQFILIWGANPTRSNIHLVPHLKAARKAGAKIAVVDPQRILGGDTVDCTLQPIPGTDVAVALAMIDHWNRHGLLDRAFLERHTTGWEQLLERAATFPLDRAAQIAKVKASDIADIAERYARSDPAVLRCGWGVERNRNGLAAVAAILALPACAGKFGVRGGGFTLSNSGALSVDDHKLTGAPQQSTRLLNMNHLGRYLTDEIDPPIKVLFVYNCNPVDTVPDGNRVAKGLEREDLFTVVSDQVMTDSAVYADIVLPATTFLEHSELKKSYGSYSLQLSEPVIEPEGEALSNSEMFQRLGRAMGWSDGPLAETPKGLLRRAVNALQGPLEENCDAETLCTRQILSFDFPGRYPVQFVTVFPRTVDGKIHLYPESLGENPYRYDEVAPQERYPLVLITPASNKTISSSLGELERTTARLRMNPEDASARGLRDGDTVRVFNDRGEIHCPLAVDDRLRSGVTALPKGIWRKSTLNRCSSTVLVPDHVTPVSGGACFNDARVDVQRL